MPLQPPVPHKHTHFKRCRKQAIIAWRHKCRGERWKDRGKCQHRRNSTRLITPDHNKNVPNLFPGSIEGSAPTIWNLPIDKFTFIKAAKTQWDSVGSVTHESLGQLHYHWTVPKTKQNCCFVLPTFLSATKTNADECKYMDRQHI